MVQASRSAQRVQQLRDRLYPREVWATYRFRRAVIGTGSPNSVLLDIGCGRDATWLKAVAPSFREAHGIDPEALDTSFDNITLAHGSAYELPFEDSYFDVIATRNVVEHLDDPARALRECRRVLRPGGKMFILTPNMRFPPLAVARVFPHTVRQKINYIVRGAEEEDTFKTYYRANTIRDVRRLAQEAGFEADRVEYFTEQPVYFTFSLLAFRCWAAFDRLCLQKESCAWLRHYIYCELRLPEDAKRS